MKLVAPVRPWRGTRGRDASGSGTFGALRDGGKRSHRGRDYIALPGDDALAPIDGRVTRHMRAYPDGDLEGLEIEAALWRAKILYVKPEVPVGTRVRAGDRIGIVQDLAEYYRGKEMEITNHVHLEIMVWIDPDDRMHRPEAA